MHICIVPGGTRRNKVTFDAIVVQLSTSETGSKPTVGATCTRRIWRECVNSNHLVYIKDNPIRLRGLYDTCTNTVDILPIPRRGLLAASQQGVGGLIQKEYPCSLYCYCIFGASSSRCHNGATVLPKSEVHSPINLHVPRSIPEYFVCHFLVNFLVHCSAVLEPSYLLSGVNHSNYEKNPHTAVLDIQACHHGHISTQKLPAIVHARSTP